MVSVMSSTSIQRPQPTALYDPFLSQPRPSPPSTSTFPNHTYTFSPTGLGLVDWEALTRSVSSGPSSSSCLAVAVAAPMNSRPSGVTLSRRSTYQVPNHDDSEEKGHEEVESDSDEEQASGISNSKMTITEATLRRSRNEYEDEDEEEAMDGRSKKRQKLDDTYIPVIPATPPSSRHLSSSWSSGNGLEWGLSDNDYSNQVSPLRRSLDYLLTIPSDDDEEGGDHEQDDDRTQDEEEGLGNDMVEDAEADEDLMDDADNESRRKDDSRDDIKEPNEDDEDDDFQPRFTAIPVTFPLRVAEDSDFPTIMDVDFSRIPPMNPFKSVDGELDDDADKEEEEDNDDVASRSDEEHEDGEEDHVDDADDQGSDFDIDVINSSVLDCEEEDKDVSSLYSPFPPASKMGRINGHFPQVVPRPRPRPRPCQSTTGYSGSMLFSAKRDPTKKKTTKVFKPYSGPVPVIVVSPPAAFSQDDGDGAQGSRMDIERESIVEDTPDDVPCPFPRLSLSDAPRITSSTSSLDLSNLPLGSFILDINNPESRNFDAWPPNFKKHLKANGKVGNLIGTAVKKIGIGKKSMQGNKVSKPLVVNTAIATSVQEKVDAPFSIPTPPATPSSVSKTTHSSSYQPKPSPEMLLQVPPKMPTSKRRDQWEKKRAEEWERKMLIRRKRARKMKAQKNRIPT